MKDLNLNIAVENGLNVPDFFVIKFDEIIPDISVILDGKLDSLSLKNRVRENALRVDLPRDFPLCAVRSACNIEDGENHSFAGQFDTFLNVKPMEINDRIIDCICSLYNESVLHYIKKNEINIADLKMNVIVQSMIESDYSGIIFTSNPQGLLNETVIVAGAGLGDKVVTDKVETTSYYYNNTDNIYYFEGENDLLDVEKISDIVSLSNNIKKAFSYAFLDIEFAIKSNEIFVLQVRKITTLKTANPLILDNSNIVESYPGISLPLTDSFVNVVYSGVFRGVARRVLKNEKILDKNSEVFKNMVGSANGRMYYKISNWYTVIKFLPFNKKIIPVWQEMLGVKNKNYDNSKVELTFFDRAKTYVNAFCELIRVPSNMKKLNNDFALLNDNFYSKFNENISADELIFLYNEIKEKLLKVWDITLLNDMYSFIFTGLVKARLNNTQNSTELLNSYISNIANIESMKPIKDLIDLAIISLDDEKKIEYEVKFSNYIKNFGDRYLEELKLESETFRTNPDLLSQKIKEYAGDKKKLFEMKKMLNFEEELALPKRGILFNFCVKRASLGIKNREISRLNRSRIFGIVRSIFLSLAKILVENSVIETQLDVFYLSIDEVFTLAKHPINMKDIVTERKAQYELYKILPAYTRLVFAEKEFNKTHKKVNATTIKKSGENLSGIPCSNGKFTGEVLVIESLSDAKNTAGKILVTKMTDPGWVFLLANAGGVIAEKGSILSHTAIISRELGIPSIVGVEKATTMLKTGDIITMDGSSGQIIHHDV